jgi:DNA repair protein RecN (Recombination protein N)
MKQLGIDRQVLAVTHLPQVASCAHQHGVVSKSNTGMPSSQITMVTGEARVREIARMLGGEVVTSAARIHAAEMLEMT